MPKDKIVQNVRPARPLLRWAGSKRQLLPTLSVYWTAKHKRYVEPFAGSARLFFHLQPKAALLGDLNSELIAMYCQVMNNVSEVWAELSSMERGKEEYYRVREIDPKTLSPAKRAARFIYLNRDCFNGLYRTNRAGKFNVPYGGDNSRNLPSRQSLNDCSQVLQNAMLVSGDFEFILERTQPGDFVYLDPPYSVKSKGIFNEYNAEQFSSNDLLRLRLWLDRLTASGIEFLVSYADCEEAELLKDGYTSKEVIVKRSIAGFVNSRHTVTEVLISNLTKVR